VRGLAECLASYAGSIRATTKPSLPRLCAAGGVSGCVARPIQQDIGPLLGVTHTYRMFRLCLGTRRRSLQVSLRLGVVGPGSPSSARAGGSPAAGRFGGSSPRPRFTSSHATIYASLLTDAAAGLLSPSSKNNYRRHLPEQWHVITLIGSATCRSGSSPGSCQLRHFTLESSVYDASKTAPVQFSGAGLRSKHHHPWDLSQLL